MRRIVDEIQHVMEFEYVAGTKVPPSSQKSLTPIPQPPNAKRYNRGGGNEAYRHPGPED